MVRAVRLVAAVGLCFALASCSADRSSSGSGTATGGASSPGAPGSASASPAASTPPPLPEQVQPSSTPSPAPSTAGDLNGNTFPRSVLGFRAVAGEAAEGEFQPNGTFVHAVDAAQAGSAAMPQCAGPKTVAGPRHALAATYADAAGRPGNGLALRFGSAAAATAWFVEFTRQVKACPVIGRPVVTSDTAITDQRSTGGEPWTEAGVVRGTLVVLVVVAGTEHNPAKVLATIQR